MLRTEIASRPAQRISERLGAEGARFTACEASECALAALA
jgi:hypothetical protein